MVGPGGRPPRRDCNSLACPGSANAPSDRKREFRCLSSAPFGRGAGKGCKRKRRRSTDWGKFNRLRRKQIARLVVRRHGRLPNPGGHYIKAAAWHCHGPDRRAELLAWLVWVCAPISLRRKVDAILRANPPRRISADRLGRHLHVSDFERSALRIYTIGSYQTPKAERVRQRKEKDRLHKQARRRASGARPHEQSLSRTKPWEARGVSRATYYRHRKAMTAVRQSRKAVRQIRRQYTSFYPSDESVSLDTVRVASSARNGNGKTNGEHSPGRRSKAIRAGACRTSHRPSRNSHAADGAARASDHDRWRTDPRPLPGMWFIVDAAGNVLASGVTRSAAN
jgi:hypothetical protein